ncbi:hypothetical protein ACQJBY_036998 [Aegilops geniculata]
MDGRTIGELPTAWILRLVESSPRAGVAPCCGAAAGSPWTPVEELPSGNLVENHWIRLASVVLDRSCRIPPAGPHPRPPVPSPETTCIASRCQPASSSASRRAWPCLELPMFLVVSNEQMQLPRRPASPAR